MIKQASQRLFSAMVREGVPEQETGRNPTAISGVPILILNQCPRFQLQALNFKGSFLSTCNSYLKVNGCLGTRWLNGNQKGTNLRDGISEAEGNMNWFA